MEKPEPNKAGKWYAFPDDLSELTSMVLHDLQQIAEANQDKDGNVRIVMLQLHISAITLKQLDEIRKLLTKPV